LDLWFHKMRYVSLIVEPRATTRLYSSPHILFVTRSISFSRELLSIIACASGTVSLQQHQVIPTSQR
jgi:hypothetical protein